MRSQKSEGRDVLGNKGSMKMYQYHSVGAQLTAKSRKVAVPSDKRPFTEG